MTAESLWKENEASKKTLWIVAMTTQDRLTLARSFDWQSDPSIEEKRIEQLKMLSTLPSAAQKSMDLCSSLPGDLDSIRFVVPRQQDAKTACTKLQSRKHHSTLDTSGRLSSRIATPSESVDDGFLKDYTLPFEEYNRPHGWMHVADQQLTSYTTANKLLLEENEKLGPLIAELNGKLRRLDTFLRSMAATTVPPTMSRSRRRQKPELSTNASKRSRYSGAKNRASQPDVCEPSFSSKPPPHTSIVRPTRYSGVSSTKRYSRRMTKRSSERISKEWVSSHRNHSLEHWPHRIKIKDSAPLGLVPSALLSLHGLETIIIQNCGLTQLPELFCKIKTLRHLDLSDNFLQDPSLVNMDRFKLKTLVLSGNRLYSPPQNLRRCTSLVTLDLSHNQIYVIPKKSLPQLLENLDLRGNPITGLDGIAGDLRRLKRVQIWNTDHQMSNSIIIKPSALSGWGAFARVDVPADSFLGLYLGETFPVDTNDQLHVSAYKLNCGNYMIDAGNVQKASFARMINGARKPEEKTKVNCITREFHSTVQIWSTRSIEEGEELILEYGVSYWSQSLKDALGDRFEIERPGYVPNPSNLEGRTIVLNLGNDYPYGWRVFVSIKPNTDIRDRHLYEWQGTTADKFHVRMSFNLPIDRESHAGEALGSQTQEWHFVFDKRTPVTTCTSEKKHDPSGKHTVPSTPSPNKASQDDQKMRCIQDDASSEEEESESATAEPAALPPPPPFSEFFDPGTMTCSL